VEEGNAEIDQLKKLNESSQIKVEELEKRREAAMKEIK
jgi:hypothetical protein